VSTGRAGQAITADKNYYSRDFEAALAGSGFCLLRPGRHDEPARPGARLLRPLRQVTEPVNATVQGQPDLERHDGHTPQGLNPHPAPHPGPDHPRSGTTTTPASPSSAPWPPTTTDRVEQVV